MPRVHDSARRLPEHLMPKTRAYYEIWLDEKQVAGSGEENEPIYGPTYLPRKFKIAFWRCRRQRRRRVRQRHRFIAIVDRRQVSVNVAAGGGLGGDARRCEDLSSSCRCARLHRTGPGRRHCERSSRRNATSAIARSATARARESCEAVGIEDRGLAERRAGFVFAPARAFVFERNSDRFGWTEGENGRLHLTLRIESGRIADRDDTLMLKGLREIARVHHGEFRLTPNQNLIVANVAPTERSQIDALVTAHGLDTYREATPLRLNALACVALPTCSQAMAEAERYLPELLQQVQAQLDRHGLHDAPIGLRISGCPNAAATVPGVIALVGKAPGRYNLMLGAMRRVNG
jgi:sulfite reductase (NADPH) hemoprotein beta-component